MRNFRVAWLSLYALCWLGLLMAPAASGQANGHLEVVEGKYVLTVWGTHAERGYAAGYLIGEQAKTVFDDYFLGYYCGGSAALYQYARTLFISNFTIDARYLEEAEAMHQGMAAAGVDLYNATLGRELDVTDFLVSNAIVDLSQYGGKGVFGCSSLSSWGESTAGDPELGGHLVITRHLDWSRHPVLTDNAVILVHQPSEADEQPWVSLTYAGLMGALSGVSQSGLAAFMNMGNVTTGTQGAPFHPILMTIRSGLEARDYDGDGGHAAGDVVAAIEDRTRCAAAIIHVVQDEGAASDPVVIECNNSAGVATRRRADNSVIPGEHLVATNHFRVLYNPSYCARYQALSDSLHASQAMTCTRSWNVMAAAAGQASNIMAIQYVPSKALLACAVDTYAQPAFMQTPTLFDLNDLFAYAPAAVPEDVPSPGWRMLPGPAVTAHPNPFHQETLLTYSLAGDSHPIQGAEAWLDERLAGQHEEPLDERLAERLAARLDVLDITGRCVRTFHLEAPSAGEHHLRWDGRDQSGARLAPGVYFCRLIAGTRTVRAARSSASGKVLLLD